VVRFAHITDVHFLSLDGSRLRDFVNKRWAGGLNLLLNRSHAHSTAIFDALVDDLNREKIDQVICTGDITNLSLESEFRFALSHFERIGIGPKNVTCVPGNHDNYIAESIGNFDRIFADYTKPDEEWRWDDGPTEHGLIDWPIVRVRGDLAVIGLSTSIPSAWFMNHGVLGEKQLSRLERALKDPRLAGKLRVIAMHHPSAGHRAKKFRRGLRDHEDFARVLGRTGAELVLHGHEHLDLREEILGPGGAEIPVMGVQSGTYALDLEKRRARYRVFEIVSNNGPDAGHGRPGLRAPALRTWRPNRKAFEAEVAA
jgi:3',5'-cyclic AMP phosphodiesterase CpdA